MTIKVQFLRDDDTPLATIDFVMPNAALFALLDAYREENLQADGTQVGRPAAAKQLARAWVHDMRANARGTRARKAAREAIAALAPDVNPTEQSTEG